MKINIKNIKIILLFLVLLFIMCLDSLTNIQYIQFFFKHVDELITIIFTLYVMINYKTLLKLKLKLIIPWILFMLIGFISTVINMYQPISAALIDAFLLVQRFMVGYLAVIIYLNKKNINISDIIVKSAKIVTVILFIIAIHDIIFTPIFPKSNFRYFTYSLQLMFPHPTYLASAEAILLIFLGYKNEKNNNYIYMLMATFVGIMTLRGKAIGFFVLYWFIYLLIFVFKNKHYLHIFILGGILCLFLVQNQFQEYFFEDRYSPRAILLKDSFELMMKHFPIGTGFGTFGSSIAVNYYSPLYILLGYPSNWGMSQSYSAFLTDSFWPTIFAQFGIIGLITFLVIILYFLKITIKQIKQNQLSGVAMLMTLAYILITSFAESSFFNPVSLLMFMLFAIYEEEK
ncbi:MAG: hypothetical protein J6A04_03660 [Clostridia bacterium]|nr:hypothetical protein [Clostridia bacterium]